MDITRKQFFDVLAGGSALLLLGGCGGGGSYGSSGGTAATSSCSPAIDANHGHTLAIPVADLSSTTPMTFNFAGTADHSHSVTLSVADLQKLKAGTPVAVTSTTSTASPTTAPHTHIASVSCVIY